MHNNFDNIGLLETFGANLRAIRKRKKLSLIVVELRSGINAGDISRIEHGRKNPSFTTLYKLAIGLEVQPYELLVDLPRTYNDMPEDSKK